jgi:hypothetical protein
MLLCFCLLSFSFKLSSFILSYLQRLFCSPQFALKNTLSVHCVFLLSLVLVVQVCKLVILYLHLCVELRGLLLNLVTFILLNYDVMILL